MNKKTRQNKAFTIIELLTVMSIIVVLIGLLVPALNTVRRYALGVKQSAQFHSIETALELFRNEFEVFPESSGEDTDGVSYCGAMKLCEAMLGQDLMGYHIKSRFLASQTLGALGPNRLYRLPSGNSVFNDNLQKRKKPYLPTDKVTAYKLEDIYPNSQITGPASAVQEMFVLTDVFKNAPKQTPGGDSKVGMPVLYYKASRSGSLNDPNEVDAIVPPSALNNGNFTYNYIDNQVLININTPFGKPHDLNTLDDFYSYIRNEKITTANRASRSDTFILISAGFDGKYGTADDVTNFN